MRRRPLIRLLVLLVLFSVGCVRNQPEVIVITATFQAQQGQNSALPAAPTPFITAAAPADQTAALPTSAPVLAEGSGGGESYYTVQPGDTLSAIAAANGVSLQALMESNNNLENPDVLDVGQIIRLPLPPSGTSSDFRIVPDSRLVRAPGSAAFDVAAFIAQQPGYIRSATDEVNGEVLTAAQIVQRVSLEFSIDARLLLAALEYRARWLSNAQPEEQRRLYPMRENEPNLGFDRRGLYRQLAWAADQLNRGYYGWKYRNLTTVEFLDGTRLLYAPSLNAATVGVQTLLAQANSVTAWQQDTSQQGFYQTYIGYFGDPFIEAVEPLVPPDLEQPALALPFAPGQTWFYTGGPHGGWGSGSAWAAVDFAPPDDLPEGSPSCYVSGYFTTAVAAGVIARTDRGTAVLDLDGDGDESTGWSILYLHVAEQDRVAAGTSVRAGDPIGRPSCEGGFSNGTHVHLARRYNGEWIPVECANCPPFNLGGWTLFGLQGQEYQGFMVNNDQQRIAEQGRLTQDNRITH
jgi:murein DD-endopeptidase MepM/ murein hydrolase activator NlpD